MRNSVLVRSLGLALLPLLLLVAACDSGGPNEAQVNNAFSLEITPTSTASSAHAAKAVRDTSIEGFSFFYAAEHPQSGEQIFGIYFNGEESFSPTTIHEGLFGFLARESAQPAPGPYTVQSFDSEFEGENFIGVLYEDLGNDGFQDAPIYLPRDGSITIDRSTDAEVSGTIDLTANALTFDTSTSPTTVDTSEVSISGSFTAKNIENFAPLPFPSSNN